MKKLHKSQSGIAHLTIIGLLLIFAIVGFTGWRVWDAKKDANEKLDTGNITQTVRSKIKPKTSNIPKGFVEYKNKELAFKFAYPKTWGKATTEPGPETSHLIKGSEYQITFTQNDNITAGVESKDREHDPNMGHGGATYASIYTRSSYANLTKYCQTTTHYRSNTSFVISKSLNGQLGEPSLATILVRKLENKIYPSIAFLYRLPFDSGNYDEVCDKTDINNYISDTQVEELKKVNSTIKSL